jgi:hypothetical protein
MGHRRVPTTLCVHGANNSVELASAHPVTLGSVHHSPAIMVNGLTQCETADSVHAVQHHQLEIDCRCWISTR